MIAGTGSLSVTGAHTINVDPTSTFPHAQVTYDLFSYGSAISGFGSLSLGTAPPLFKYSLSNNTAQKQVDLVVSPFEFAWTGQDNAPGASDSNWTTNAANTNWVDNLTGVNSPYSNGARVFFGDTYPTPSGTGVVTNGTVTIQAAGVVPGPSATAVIFTNSAVTYTVGNASGSNGIGGSAGIQMTGNGLVNLQGANTFSGTVAVGAGILNLTNSAALGNSSGASVASGAGLVLNNVSTGSTVTGSNPIPLTIDGVGTGSGLAANGVLTATGTSAYAGPISVGSSSAATIFANASANLTLSGGVHVPSGSTLTINGPGNVTVSGGSLADSSPTGTGTLVKSGTGTLNLSSPLNFYGGGTQISGGLVVPANFNSLGTGPVTFTSSTGILRVSPQPANSLFLGGPGAGPSQWTLNSGGAYVPPAPTLVGNTLTATTNAGGENTSSWYNTPVSIQNGFAASFQFQSLPAGGADGVSFALQSVNNTTPLHSLGAGGGSLGYGGIGNSAAFEIEVYSGAPPGVLWANNGVAGPYTATGGVTLNSGDLINVSLSYNPVNTTMSAQLTDTVTGATFSYTNSSFNLATVLGGNNAYIGFTGGTGGVSAANIISNFSFPGSTPPPVVVNAGSIGTIDVAATVADPTVAVGALTSGANSQLNVTATTVTTAGQAYGLSIPSATLSGTTTFNVANAAGGGVGTVTLASIADGSSPGAITKTGASTLRVTANFSQLAAGTGYNQNFRQYLHGWHHDQPGHVGSLGFRLESAWFRATSISPAAGSNSKGASSRLCPSPRQDTTRT